jgi:hypothetical protein
MDEKLKLYLTVVITGLAVVVLAFAVWYRAGHGPAGSHNATSVPAHNFQVTDIDVSQLPPGLPANLPIEKGAVVTRNNDTTDTVTGGRQSERTYITQLGIAANFAAYKQYLAANKWKIVATLDHPSTLDQPDAANYKTISATNGAGGGNGMLNIIFDYHRGGTNHLVSIYYTYMPATAK